MFDLEYYNEITDFGKLAEKLYEECRKRGNSGFKNISNNKTTTKERNAIKCEHYLNGLILFEKKHSNSYCSWYANYYNKNHVMDKLSNQYKTEGIVRPVDKLHSGICIYKN